MGIKNECMLDSLHAVAEFHETSKNMKLSHDDRLDAADVNDFFAVGQHQNVERRAISILEREDRALGERLMHFFLTNRFQKPREQG